MLDATIDFQLMSTTGNASEVETIFVAAIDRPYCEQFLGRQSSTIPVVETKTPLVACESAAADPRAAAVAYEPIGTQAGLRIAQRSIVDRAGERVRYAVIGARPSRRTGQDLTSVAFGVRDAPDSLLDVLKVLAERGIHLTKVQSHPVRGAGWTYLFCVEMAGHFTDRPLVAAFEEMKRLARSFQVLGSYPTG
jgi:chorismate mutase / prephenate dehydratase